VVLLIHVVVVARASVDISVRARELISLVSDLESSTASESEGTSRLKPSYRSVAVAAASYQNGQRTQEALVFSREVRAVRGCGRVSLSGTP